MSQLLVKPAVAMISCRLSSDDVSSASDLINVIALHDQSTDLVTVYDQKREVVCVTHVHCLLNIRHMLVHHFDYTHWLFVDDDDMYDLTALWRLAFMLTSSCDVLYYTRKRITHMARARAIELLMQSPAWWQRFTSTRLINAGAYDKGRRKPGEDARFVQSVYDRLSPDNVIVVELRLMPYIRNLTWPSVCHEWGNAARPTIRTRTSRTTSMRGWRTKSQ